MVHKSSGRERETVQNSNAKILKWKQTCEKAKNMASGQIRPDMKREGKKKEIKKKKDRRYADTTGRGDSDICYAFLG
jgi:hypothetical protein